MTALTLEGHQGSSVAIDRCPQCQVFWFDHLESLRLSPAATLQLFKAIGEGERDGRRPLGSPLKCPRCGLRLTLTNDRQRNTPFRYWRCPREHGRLIGDFDFLREKDFIRPLSPKQLAELRENVQAINCSNCGAPIDLVHASECAHCGTPISMLDVKQISAMAQQLQPSVAPHPAVDVSALFEALKADRIQDGPSGLVEAGLRLIVGWIR